MDLIHLSNEDIYRTKVDEKIRALETSYKRENKLKKEVEVIDTKLETSQKEKLWGSAISLLLLTSLISAVLFFK
jgi:hypothetical protein